MTLAVIGGSGLAEWPELDLEPAGSADTPWGAASCAPMAGVLAGVRVLFLPRHGADHALAPHRINYRANLHALHAAGARMVVAVATVGAIRAEFRPGDLVLPDQLLDYTHGRAATYFDGVDGPLRHIDFSVPFDTQLRQRLLAAAKTAGVALADGATYAVTQGPRLETAAEVNRLERDGADLIGMTAMPEAALARELNLPYALLGVVANRAAGRGTQSIFEEIAAHQTRGIDAAQRVLRAVAPMLGKD